MNEQSELELLRIWKQDAIEKMQEQESEIAELTEIITEMQAAIDATYRPLKTLLALSTIEGEA